MDETVTIGHPAEFFRELKKVFTSIDDDMRIPTTDKKLDLVETPIGGVAKFEGDLRGRCFHEVVSTNYQIAGAGVICAAVAGIGLVLLFFSIENLLNLIALSGFFVLLIIGGVAVGLARKQFLADLWLTFEGESYQAKSVGPQGERVSVFSRALLKTDWGPTERGQRIPSEFSKKMEENKLKLDLGVSGILQAFELKGKSEIPDTKSSEHFEAGKDHDLL